MSSCRPVIPTRSRAEIWMPASAQERMAQIGRHAIIHEHTAVLIEEIDDDEQDASAPESKPTPEITPLL